VRIQFTAPARRIIGVVGDIGDRGLNNNSRPLMIVPGAQLTDGITTLNSNITPMHRLVRTHGDPHQYISAITEQLRQASGRFPAARVRPMSEVVVQSTVSEDYHMLLLTIFAASALILAAIGI
jgi:putative ABC transport system permease protein